MAQHTVRFDVAAEPVGVQTGTLLTEAAQEAGVEITQPCGGQGRCGRCMVKVSDGDVWLVFPNATISIEGICKFGTLGPIVRNNLRAWRDKTLEDKRK